MGSSLGVQAHDRGLEPGRAPVWLVPAGTGDDVGAAARATSYCYLLDIDTDLAEEFDLRMRIVARQVATTLVVDVAEGACDLAQWFETGTAGLGLLVVDGVIAVDVHVGERTATELVGASDLLQPWLPGEEQLLERRATWRVLVPARIAVLDAAFVERIRPWPEITRAFLRRAGRRARELHVQRAIGCHPRLEVRIALLFWHLAGRWGRVEPGGIRLELPLTHALLGRLVGAERPSVSHALARLSEAGLVTAGAGHLRLHGSVEEHMARLATTHLTHRPRRVADGA